MPDGQKNKNKMTESIAISIDFIDEPGPALGVIYGAEKGTIHAQIRKMLEHGYSFELSPSILVKEVNEAGVVTDGELLGVSLITSSAKKYDVAKNAYLEAPDIKIIYDLTEDEDKQEDVNKDQDSKS